MNDNEESFSAAMRKIRTMAWQNAKGAEDSGQRISSSSMRQARREAWANAEGKPAEEVKPSTPPTSTAGFGLNDDPRIVSLESRMSNLLDRLDRIEDDFAEDEKGEDGGFAVWSGRLLSLHGAVLWEEDPDGYPAVVIGGVFICVDTSYGASPVVSWNATAKASPRYICWEVAESDGNGGFVKIKNKTVGDIRVPVILGSAPWSILTQKDSTTGIDMGYLRAIGGSVP